MFLQGVGTSQPKVSRSSQYISNITVIRKNIQRDGVDEHCNKEGTKYRKWEGTKGHGLHKSQVKTSTTLIDYVAKYHFEFI